MPSVVLPAALLSQPSRRSTLKIVKKNRQEKRRVVTARTSELALNFTEIAESKRAAPERTYWIAKVLRQIENIEPGMRRKELGGIFTAEGGLSNRFERTYVHVDCPYIVGQLSQSAWLKSR